MGIAGWRDGRIAGWRDGAIAGWRDSRMAWPDGLMELRDGGDCDRPIEAISDPTISESDNSHRQSHISDQAIPIPNRSILNPQLY